MRTENSPAYEAEMRKRLDEMDRKRESLAAVLVQERTRWRDAGCPWMPIRKCPFAALDEVCGIGGAILVSDGNEVAVATITSRFGRPIFYKKQPEMVLRDGMMCMVGGEEDPREDLPEWWWKWEVRDELASETWAYGEPAGQPEVEFIPTLWTFLPDPPSPNISKA